MSKPNLYLLFVLLSGLMCLFPYEAFSIAEIEFHVTNDTGTEKCFQCSGPFSRETPRVNIAPGGTTYFYTAEVNSLSPFGPWSCFIFITDTCFDPGPIPDGDTISTVIGIPAGTAVVELTIVEFDGSPVINVRFPGGLGAADGDVISAASFLGDDQASSGKDSDTFRFNAEEGDRVTIRLDDDPSAGRLGDVARLRLRSDRRIGNFQEAESGELPLELTVTIPETGMYEVTVGKVAQSDVPDNLLSFKGGYILSVDSEPQPVEKLIPGENVER